MTTTEEETIVAPPEIIELTHTERKELDDLMKSYNELILEDLRHHFNHRQKWSKRLEQLFLQYKVEYREGKTVRVDVYLTTHNKLLANDWEQVKDETGKFTTTALRKDLRRFMIQIMKAGLSTIIRKAKPLPEELI